MDRCRQFRRIVLRRQIDAAILLSAGYLIRKDGPLDWRAHLVSELKRGRLSWWSHSFSKDLHPH